MLSSALLSLGVAGSALAWPSIGHSRHSSIARAIHARQEPAVKAKEPVAATWFASWHADEFSLANVSWSKYTTVSYSFAVTTPNISFVNISDPEVFKDFVSTAHANNVSATISIGGWTGSLYFSSAVATAENRTEFVKTMVSLLEDNNLDGLSFDWEYPGASGVGCNTKSVNDTDNFLLFLKELRTALPSNATLSAATSITPFLSVEGTPSTNVSEFASVFDYIQLMNYDVWGPWSDTTGPNAPLNDTCATNATQKVGSAVSAIEAWTKAGFPADQLVLGVAGYGHGFSVESASALSDGILNAYSPFNKSFTPPGDAWDDAPVNGTVDVCGNPQAQGGTWNFWGLIEGGFLNENGTANTAEGIAYKYDECSQTPFVYNQTSGVMVAFDNAASFTAKGQFINATGLRGFALWEAGGDFDDILLNAIRSGAGFPEVVEDYDDCDDDETGTTTPETGNASNNSGSNNSGNNSGSTSSNNSGSNNSASNNSGSSNSGSTSSNSGSTSTSNNSGSSSSNNSGSNSSSNSSNGSSSTTPSTSNNSGSNNSGNNGSGSSTTTPDYDDDEDDDCEDDDEPTTVTSAATSKPTATATSEDDDECEDDDEYSEPEATTIANPTTYQAPTAVPTATTPSTSAAQSAPTPDATLPDDEDDEDEECEDDETIIDATTSVSASGTASATSTVSAASTDAISSTSAAPTATSSVASSSEATVTSTASEGTYTSSAASATATESAATLSSVASESSTVTETASTSQPTASADELIVSSSSASTESYEPSATTSNAEPTTSVRSSSSAASTSSEPATVTSSYEASESSEPTASARQTSSYESQASSEPTASTESSSSAAPTSTHPAPSSSHPAPSTSAQPTSSEPAVPPAAPTSASSSSSSAAPTAASPSPTDD